MHRPAFTPRPLLLALLSVFAGNAAAADTATVLNPVVVTGSRAEAASFDLPYSIDVVDSRTIGEGKLGVNASEALAGVPGLVIQNRNNYAQDLQISSRGFGTRAAFGVRGIKLITDGIPASTPDGQGQAATFNLDTAERIEVLRGPFSTVYGASSGGVIQLFSRDGKGKPSLKAGVTAGSWGTSKIELGAEGAVGDTGYILNTSRFDSNGFRDHSAVTRDQVFGKLSFVPDADSTLKFTVSSLKQNGTQDPLGLKWATFKADPSAVESNATTYNTRKNIDHMQGGLQYARQFGAGRLEFNAYAGTRSVTQYLSIPSFVQAAPTHSGGVVDFDRSFHGFGARWIHTLDAGPGELTLTGGLDYDRSEDDRKGYENFIGTTLGVKGNLRRDEINTVTSIDPYAQASWKVGDVTLQAGLRHSHVEYEVDDAYLSNGDGSGTVSYRKTTPAVGVLWAVTPALNLYASAARGFETPTVTEMSYASAGGGFNFDLKPARSVQYELGAKAFLSDNTRLNAAIFQIRTDDELVVASSSGGRTVYANAAKTLRQGMEVALDSEFSEQWRARLAVTWLRAIYDGAFNNGSNNVADGSRMPGIPATSAFGEIVWQPRSDLSAALETQYRSKVYVEDSNTERAAPAYTVFNLRLAAEQKMGPWKLTEMVRLDNLFDRSYVGSVIVGDGNGRFYEPGSGFGWFAGVSARYSFD
ncbi:MAG TPA: TonB-dependent receptor [Denitromonas sp.]|nr:TonB-dependent receptor [Zoogloeaceae bacterium]HQU88442.1 TonB-dependent receptor [Denitromonas sp.]HQV13411.1 TonB-dependent receptor [Denitromonas sp.]